ncbi:AbrB family transcriptional regulator [Pantanalinema rosaneae CENA516]|uniref:AbrB family transcriptional regulator n=1 Tax=Pantanalinema rosaneae TaxID=1620701 RepID=UPI003D6F3BE1
MARRRRTSRHRLRRRRAVLRDQALGSHGSHALGLVWAASLLSLSAIVATLGPPLLGQPTGALLLAFAPGGTAEMTILSIAIGIEVAFVITCQVSR